MNRETSTACLATLLRLRRSDEELARLSLAGLRQREQVHRLRIRQARQAMSDQGDEARRRVLCGQSPCYDRRLAAKLRGEERAEAARLQGMEVSLRQARQNLLETMSRRKVLEMLQARRQAFRQRLELRRATDEMDDLHATFRAAGGSGGGG